MLLINCPHCGPCDETEFHYGGEAHITRPAVLSDLDDNQLADFLFNRTNPKGVHAERWVHRDGCRKWFNMLRHTVTHQILAVYAAGTSAPDISRDAGDQP